MKRVTLLFLLINIGCSDLVGPTFEIITYDLDQPKDSIAYSIWYNKHLKGKEVDRAYQNSFYKDDEYETIRFCMGEWGGHIGFIEKGKPDSVYFIGATCPVMVDRRKEGYIITSSLSHGGSGRIQLIKSPKDLVKVHKDSVRTRANTWESIAFPGLDDMEIYQALQAQGQTLIDTFKFTFNVYFPYNNFDFLIYADNRNTYLGQVIDKKFYPMKVILPFPTLASRHGPNTKINGFYQSKFEYYIGFMKSTETKKVKSEGDFYIRNDTIVTAYRHKTWYEARPPFIN